MKNFKDRIASPSNQYRLTATDTNGIYTIEVSPDSVTDEGTPINRLAMMAIQGFYGNLTEFLDDGSIRETNQDGDVKLTVFNEDGSIIETFTETASGTVISKTTNFNSDGSITEQLA